MSSYDASEYINPRKIEMYPAGQSDSPLSMSPDSASLRSIQGADPPTPPTQFYQNNLMPLDKNVLMPLDFAMYDPGLLSESYSTDDYFSTDPLFLGGLDVFDQSTTFDSPNSNSSTSKRSPLSTSAIEGQYKLSPMSSHGDSYPSTSPLEGTAEEDCTADIPKRQRASQPDTISACWTSPLCPNNTKGGTLPSPSTCDGGCAPFLFADGQFPETSIDTALINMEDLAQELKYSPSPSEPRSSSKRTDSQSSSNNPLQSRSGRRLPKPATGTNNTRYAARKSSPVRKESTAETVSDSDTKASSSNKKRIPHNEVERKYRDSVNHQMDCLRRVIPDLRPHTRICEGADIEDLPAPAKPSKAMILASATAYIKNMERERKKMEEENEVLLQKVKRLQALVKCDDCSLVAYVRSMNLRGGKT